jgi:hypothetical protein
MKLRCTYWHWLVDVDIYWIGCTVNCKINIDIKLMLINLPIWWFSQLGWLRERYCAPSLRSSYCASWCVLRDDPTSWIFWDTQHTGTFSLQYESVDVSGAHRTGWIASHRRATDRQRAVLQRAIGGEPLDEMSSHRSSHNQECDRDVVSSSHHYCSYLTNKEYKILRQT